MLILQTKNTNADKLFFENLFNKYKKQMFLLAYSILHNSSDAEDAVQNAFIGVINNSRKTVLKINNDIDMRNYLLKVTKNSCLDITRKSSREILSDAFLSQSTDVLNDTDFIKAVCDRLDYEELVSAIKALDPKYKEALYYHFVLEFTISETASILKQNISTTKMQLVRGKKQLISIINSKGGALYVNK